MPVKLVKDGKFEFLYIKDAIAYYPKVHQPANKYQSTDREYTITLFVTDEDRAVLEDEVLVNKTLYKVGKDKNKKRVIKYAEDKYQDVSGLNGIQISLNEFNKSGRKNALTVIDSNGNPITDNIGNGSRVSVKCFGYRNVDDALVVSLQTIMVDELVPYESGGSGDGYYDAELGVSIPKAPKKDSDAVTADVDDDEIPF
jgi:hypothetical protein